MYQVTFGKRDVNRVIDETTTYPFEYFCEALDCANDAIGTVDFITITLVDNGDCIAWYDRDERRMVIE